MKIKYTRGGEYPDCIIAHLELEELSTNNSDKSFYYGWNSLGLAPNQDFIYKSFLNTAQPCEIASGEIHNVNSQLLYNEVFTICPYSAKVLNSIQTKTKFTPVCFPFREKKYTKYKNITIKDKEYDAIYYGNIHHGGLTQYTNMIDTISEFKYAFASSNTWDKQTHHNLTSIEKWDLLSKCKVNVGYNLLFLNQNQVENMRNLPNIKKFENYEAIFKHNQLPQMKTRMVEAALTKTLMAVYKDDWNVIEHWFTPGKDFVYWENIEELRNLLKDVQHNYGKYWPIVESAHKKVQNYSIDKLLNKIKNER